MIEGCAKETAGKRSRNTNKKIFCIEIYYNIPSKKRRVLSTIMVY